jgi:hypothetical protein
MDTLKRPDLSDWPEWLQDGPVLGRYSFDGKQWHEGAIIWYDATYGRPYVCVAKTDIGVIYAKYAVPIYQWQPEPDEPVLWWSTHAADHAEPHVGQWRYSEDSFSPRDTHYCKLAVINPWTVGECRRRLAAGELTEYKP